MTLLQPTTRSSSLEVMGLFFCSLILFTWGLYHQEIIGFESRFYLFALEMWRYGVNWFPTTYQQPYADYPASSTLLIYLTATLLGGMNKLVAVLPSAIAAAITLTLTYLLGAERDKRWGWYAALLMLLTIAFLKNARSLSLDMYTTLFTTCCFYVVYTADSQQKPHRSKWVYLFLFLAFAFRGPIGLVMPTGVICLYYLLGGHIKRFFVTGFLALGLLILCTLLLLGLAYHVGGYVFLQDVLRMEVLGRIESSSLPRYFYLTDGMVNYALSFPLALLVLLGVCYYALYHRVLSADKQLLIKLFGWMAVILVGMSIPGDKKIRYILPMAPAIALVASYLFVAPDKETYFLYLRRLTLGLFAFFPLLFLVALAYAHAYAKQKSIDIPLSYFFIILLLSAMQVLNGIVLYCYRKHGKRLTSYILFITTLTVVMVNNAIVEPVEIYLDKARTFVQQIEVERQRGQHALVFYKERADSLPIKYLINMPQAGAPLFIDSREALQAFTVPAFFVTSASYFDALPQDVAATFRVIAKDSLGHVNVVVFTQG